MRNRRNKGRGVLNTSNPDWNEDRGEYGRGYRDHGYEGDRGDFNYGSYEGNLGYGTSIGGRYENYGADRNYNDRGNYSTQYSRDSGFNRGRYSGDRDEGFTGYNDWRTSLMDRVIAIILTMEASEVPVTDLVMNTTAPTMKEETIIGAAEIMAAEIMDRITIGIVMNAASVAGGIRLPTK